MRPVALYDANVLYPAPLRDLLMQLAYDEVIQAHWTNQIHDEWIRNVSADRPDLKLQKLQAVAQLMDSSVEGALIHGFEALIETLTLPDPNDRHILAAAIHAKAQVIVTNNLKDFPSAVLAPFGIQARNADNFILGVLETNQAAVIQVLRTIQSRLRKPPVAMAEYLATLEQVGLKKSIEVIKALI